MTVDTMLRRAAADTNETMVGLASQPPGRRRWLPAVAGAATALIAVVAAVILWQSSGAVPQSMASFGVRVEAEMQPTASLTEINLADELVQIDGTPLADLEVRHMSADDTGTLWITVAEPTPATAERPLPARLYGFDGQDWWHLEVPAEIWGPVIAGDSQVLWINTGEGLGRFDGENWTFYSSPEGAPTTGINSAKLDSNGHLWTYSIGMIIGRLSDNTAEWLELPRVSVFDGASWRHWAATETDEQWELGYLAIAADGTPWIATGAAWGEGTPGGVWSLRNETWIQEWVPTHPLTDFHNAIAADPSGAIWVSHRDTVLRIVDGTTRVFDASDGIGVAPGDAVINWRPEDIVVRNNEVWVATGGGGISRYDGTTWETFDERQGLPDRYVRDIAIGPGDDLWLRLGQDGQQVVVFDP